MRSNPELASPEFQAALQQLRSNPAALRQLIDAMSEEGGGGMDTHVCLSDGEARQMPTAHVVEEANTSLPP